MCSSDISKYSNISIFRGKQSKTTVLQNVRNYFPRNPANIPDNLNLPFEIIFGPKLMKLVFAGM